MRSHEIQKIPQKAGKGLNSGRNWIISIKRSENCEKEKRIFAEWEAVKKSAVFVKPVRDPAYLGCFGAYIQ